MMNHGFGSFMPLFLAAHGLFMMVTIVGVILLIVWANKFLKEKQLRSLVELLLIVGIVGCVLTLGSGIFFGSNHKYAAGGMMHFEKGAHYDNTMMFDASQMPMMQIAPVQ